MGSSTNVNHQSSKYGSIGRKSQRNSLRINSQVDKRIFIEHFSSCKGIYSKTVDSRINHTGRDGGKVESARSEQRVCRKQSGNKMDRDSPVPILDLGGDKENLQWFSKGKAANTVEESARWSKLSLQSLTEIESIDNFLGPFSWKTKSLQDMSFPHSDNEEEAENRPSQRHCKELSNHYVTLDGLKEKLKRDYLEAQEQREKYRHMLSSGGSKSIQRTEESVEFMSRNTGPGRTFNATRSRFPLSPLGNSIDDQPKYQFSPVKLKPVFDGPSHSKYNGIIEKDLDDGGLFVKKERPASTDSETEQPEVRLTVKQISEGLENVLFKNKSPMASPVTPTADNVMDFLKDW